MKAVTIGFLLALPGLTFFVYSGAVGGSGHEWKYFWSNYAWCSAVLYVAAVFLAATRARFGIWLVSLIAGNLALVVFCLWMAILLARGYRDTEIGWVLLFPVELFIIWAAVLAQSRVSRKAE